MSPGDAPRVPATAPALPGLGWRVTLWSLRRLPQGALSRGFGWLADRRIPRSLRPLVLGGFVRITGIRMEEAERPLESYTSVNRLFVRRLRPGARSWPGDPALLASPVDGVVGAVGTLTGGTLVQAKGRYYQAADLLGSREEAERHEGGCFITIYLSPRHYHRIHTPLPGTVTRARHIPGGLLPVNRAAVTGVEGLFARNERLLAALDTRLGRVTLVAVGAYNVGRISAAFDPEWAGAPGASVTNRPSPLPRERRYPEGVPLEAGAELMAFHLGSTVVLLTERGVVPTGAAEPGTEVSAGTVLARPRT